jgi:hypothetical protein
MTISFNSKLIKDIYDEIFSHGITIEDVYRYFDENDINGCRIIKMIDEINKIEVRIGDLSSEEINAQSVMITLIEYRYTGINKKDKIYDFEFAQFVQINVIGDKYKIYDDMPDYTNTRIKNPFYSKIINDDAKELEIFLQTLKIILRDTQFTSEDVQEYEIKDPYYNHIEMTTFDK